MKSDLRMVRGLAVAPLFAGALVGGLMAAPAQAAPPAVRAAAPSTTGRTCAEPTTASLTGRGTPIVRDHGESAQVVAANEAALTSTLHAQGHHQAARAAGNSQRTPDAATARKVIHVRVIAHVIQPSKKHVIGKVKLRQQIRIMNRAYNAHQSKGAYKTRIHFSLRRVDFTVNKSFWSADLGTKASKRMRHRLHKGTRRTLNMYFNNPRSAYGVTLGYATFPQRVRSQPGQDGVVINVGSLKGGRFRGYNRGDTAVHEVGHWLGLYHTFQGGCGSRNDYVTDTPRERTPNLTCPQGRNTCSAPGADPIHNFMDYSYDTCMNRFTRGQSERMKLHWLAFRA